MNYALTARTDVVGSLLRPPELLEAKERYLAGEFSAAEFKRVEDRAVDRALELQEEAGLDVVTDVEMRRESFQSQLVETVEGFGELLGLVTTKTRRHKRRGRTTQAARHSRDRRAGMGIVKNQPQPRRLAGWSVLIDPAQEVHHG